MTDFFLSSSSNPITVKIVSWAYHRTVYGTIVRYIERLLFLSIFSFYIIYISLFKFLAYYRNASLLCRHLVLF